MIRLLIFGALVYLLYRALKSWIFKDLKAGRTEAGSADRQQIDDIMVKDPFYNTYFPKRNALRVEHKGETLYFCSQECKQKYLTTDSEPDKQP